MAQNCPQSKGKWVNDVLLSPLLRFTNPRNGCHQAPRNLFLSGGHELSKAQMKLFRMSENSSSLRSEHASAAEILENQHAPTLGVQNDEAHRENDGTPAASCIPTKKLPPQYSEINKGSLARVLEDASVCSSESAEASASVKGGSEVQGEVLPGN
jgi:hypothetical protein